MEMRCENSHNLHGFFAHLSLFMYLCNEFMEQMQFTAVVLLTLLLVKLLLMPNKMTVNPVVGKARWLMTIGIALLDFQFLMQYALGLRALGISQAVLLNLLLFIPSSWTISLAVIILQKQGHVKLVDKLVGGITWVVALLVLGITVAFDGQSLLDNSPKLFWAEVVTSVFYLLMQGYYAWQHVSNLRSMRLALQNYYDREMDDMLLWMKYSIIVMMSLAMMAPMLIFIKSEGLSFFGILFFAGIFYMVDTFCHYMVSSAPKKMMKAGSDEQGIVENKTRRMVESAGMGEHRPEINRADVLPTVEDTTPEEPLSHPTSHFSLSGAQSSLIEKWIEQGGYRKSGLTMPAAAEGIGIPRYLLSSWLKQHDLTYAAWMNELRINEAMRVIAEHPHWTNEAIAQHCGFSDRSYFQKKFKEKTGLSPAEFHNTKGS